MLIEAESEEYSRLQSALGFSREILSFVNKTVSEHQNRMKLAEIEKKLDTRPMENSSDPLLKEYKVSVRQERNGQKRYEKLSGNNKKIIIILGLLLQSTVHFTAASGYLGKKSTLTKSTY